jgi:hypothetical protein
VGPVSAIGPRVSGRWQDWVHDTGCTQHFPRLIFKRDLKNGFFRIYVNALENHNLLILAPKLVKQILVDF